VEKAKWSFVRRIPGMMRNEVAIERGRQADLLMKAPIVGAGRPIAPRISVVLRVKGWLANVPECRPIETSARARTTP